MPVRHSGTVTDRLIQRPELAGWRAPKVQRWNLAGEVHGFYRSGPNH
jgi:hypothetical protein